ncbi:hypothetical protein IHC92_20755 [Photobacterium damselae subsp. damselae]|uniref:hypothetical protein n=1 Tax=Photobacterium damselae TaxID=38293 RepID=UPI001F165533|nr:hypothetical protein [Photobacterium damselae]UKA23385.1 hypothetical protein IHC92_20755 [Photobacterium damselae subsp. damselae]
MANVLLNYFFQFSERKGTPPPDYSFLHRVAVAVKSNKGSLEAPYLVDIYDEETAKAHTDNTGVLQLIAGGLSSIRLLVTDSLANADKLLDDTEFYTFGISTDFEEAQSSAFVPSNFGGVVYSVSTRKSNALKLVSDNAKKREELKEQYKKLSFAALSRNDNDINNFRSTAEKLAIMYRRCAFFDVNNDDSGAHYAFGKLLSSTYWRDQQYILARDPAWAATAKGGEADDLFNKRISFYLTDKTYGTRLAFFGAGGEGITEAYIDRFIQLDMQGTGLNYVSANFPKKTTSSRIKIEDRLQDVIDKYKAPPFEYLDPEKTNKISLFDSGEMYYLTGLLNIQVAEPIWRIKVEVTQE